MMRIEDQTELLCSWGVSKASAAEVCELSKKNPTLGSVMRGLVKRQDALPPIEMLAIALCTLADNS